MTTNQRTEYYRLPTERRADLGLESMVFLESKTRVRFNHDGGLWILSRENRLFMPLLPLLFFSNASFTCILDAQWKALML